MWKRKAARPAACLRGLAKALPSLVKRSENKNKTQAQRKHRHQRETKANAATGINEQQMRERQ